MGHTGTPERRTGTYNSVEANITTGTTNTPISFGSVNNAYYIEVINDHLSSNITVRINGNTNPVMTVKAGEARAFNGIIATSLFMTNASGNTVAHRTTIWGEPSPS